MVFAAVAVAKLFDMLQKQRNGFWRQIQRLQDRAPDGTVGIACASLAGDMIRTILQTAIRNTAAYAGGTGTCAAIGHRHAYTPGKRPLPSVAIGASGMAAKRVSRLRYSTL